MYSSVLIRKYVIYNRGIFCDGDLPHLATPITHINPSPSRPAVPVSSKKSDGDGTIYCSKTKKNSERGIDLDTNMNTDKNTDTNTCKDTNMDKDQNTDKDKYTNTDKNTNTSKDEDTRADMSMKRVILGFNCFPPAVDECCRRAPEHSGTDTCIYIYL